MAWQSDKYGFRSHGSWGSEDDIYLMFFDAKEMSKFLQDEESEAIAKAIEEGGKEKTEKQVKKEEEKEKKDSVKQAEKPKKLELDLEHRDYRIKNTPAPSLAKRSRRETIIKTGERTMMAINDSTISKTRLKKCRYMLNVRLANDNPLAFPTISHRDSLPFLS